MISETTHLDAAGVLAAARGAKRSEDAAAVEVLKQAVAWARLHEVTDLEEAATWWAGRGQDTGIPIAGEGAPLVSEFAVIEFATALAMSTDSGRRYLAQAIELYHRLPRVWARVEAGQLVAWRARRIAEVTLNLSAEAAAFVDVQLAPFAHKVGLAQTQRTVEEAIARFMPEFARERREQAADQRHCDVEHDQVSFAGTSRFHGELDLADALDFEDAIAARAQQQADLGSTESLNVRRALAVGMLARGEQPLDLRTGGEDRPANPPADNGSTTGPAKRQVVLYVHLSEDAIRTHNPDHNPDAPVRLENAGGQLLTAGQVAAWCGRPDTARVTVKPVIDLNQSAAVSSYQVPDWLAEKVRLRDGTCVYPYCTRPARRTDLDHIVPYDPAGPPGQTAMDNLACLCRRHHRIKTHGGWTYTMVDPGVFLWRSPHGHTYLRDTEGTTDLTPPPVTSPTQPPDR